ncbi:spermatid perinuclear RNA-binding protein isoform X1, partial [Clarias magur]
VVSLCKEEKQTRSRGQSLMVLSHMPVPETGLCALKGQRSIRSFGNDDRHVMAKHSTIYPSSEALEAVQSLVSTVECALKHVSDWMDQPQAEQPNQSSGQEDKPEPSADESAEESTNEGGSSTSSSSSTSGGDGRVLCGVMRVGLVAKGLLIKDDMDLELVLMCREKPTHTLLRTVCENLPLQIEKLAEEKYEVESSIPEGAILIRGTAEPKLRLKVTLTSPLIREDGETPEQESAVEASEPSDLLDRQRCLVALASLRHAKWFQ